MADEALSECEKALELDPRNARAHNTLGVAYEKRNLMDEAVNSFREAVALNPNFAVAYNNLGLAYLKQDLFFEAISEFHTALEINPIYSEVQSNLALTHHRLAIEHANKAIEMGFKVDGALFESKAEESDKA